VEAKGGNSKSITGRQLEDGRIAEQGSREYLVDLLSQNNQGKINSNLAKELLKAIEQNKLNYLEIRTRFSTTSPRHTTSTTVSKYQL